MNTDMKIFLKSVSTVEKFKIDKKRIFNFISIDGQEKSLKYPYKPALMMAIIDSLNEDVDLVFNNEISLINNPEIVKKYYDIIMNSATIYQCLKTWKNKKQWYLGYNHETEKSVMSNIFEAPLRNLEPSTVIEKDRTKKTIKINFNGTREQKINLLQELKSIITSTLNDAIPEYEGLSFNEIVNYQTIHDARNYLNIIEETNNDTINNKDSDDEYIYHDTKQRRYQHIFRKIIFERDNKCKICCLSEPSLLEAAHLKPYCTCDNSVDKYSADNGILLCRNHHALYDEGLFSFDEQWKVIISSKFKDHQDSDLLFKTFEECYKKELGIMVNDNQYARYHRENIFLGKE